MCEYRFCVIRYDLLSSNVIAGSRRAQDAAATRIHPQRAVKRARNLGPFVRLPCPSIPVPCPFNPPTEKYPTPQIYNSHHPLVMLSLPLSFGTNIPYVFQITTAVHISSPSYSVLQRFSGHNFFKLSIEIDQPNPNRINCSIS